MRNKCKTCGASDGFIIIQPITGQCHTRYDSIDLGYMEEQDEMYSINHGKPKIKLECCSCNGHYGNIKEIGFDAQALEALGYINKLGKKQFDEKERGSN